MPNPACGVLLNRPVKESRKKSFKTSDFTFQIFRRLSDLIKQRPFKSDI